MTERERIADAFIAGALSVHEYWTENPGEAPRGDPEFEEEANDYALARASTGDGSGEAVAWRKQLSEIDGHFTYSNVGGDGWHPLYAHPPAREGGGPIPAQDGWQPIEMLPERPGQYDIRSVTTYRWLPYKMPNDGGRKGRWQAFNGYGYQNADLPERGDWMPNLPAPTEGE